MSDNEYRIRSVPVMDLCAALNYEAERAEREQMVHTAERQRKLALHLRNAERTMVELCPDGYRVETDLVTHLVPNVNPVRRDW